MLYSKIMDNLILLMFHYYHNQVAALDLKNRKDIIVRFN